MSPKGRREQVAFACERGLSERRACGLLDISRSTLGYELRLPIKDRPVIEAMKALSSQYPRYGYRLHPHLFEEAPGTPARLASGSPAVAPGRVATAASPSEAAHRQRPATSAAGDWCELHVGL